MYPGFGGALKVYTMTLVQVSPDQGHLACPMYISCEKTFTPAMLVRLSFLACKACLRSRMFVRFAFNFVGFK